jgi:hypothetical protein
MYRGDTPEWALAVVDANGDPFSLTGWTVRMTAKRNPADSDAEAVFRLSTDPAEPGITVTNAAGGLATVQPLRTSTNTLTADTTVVWDVQVAKDGSPDLTFTVDSGTLLIRRDITRTAP